MKILWLCNVAMRDADAGGTGTWLRAMAEGVRAGGQVDLAVITAGPVRQVTRQDHHEVRQWIVPDRSPVGRDGLPPRAIVRDIVEASAGFSPDVVHVWGTEGYWGLFTARGLIGAPALLEMQGLKLAIADTFYGGLTPFERLRCVGIKEVLKRRTMRGDRRAFVRWGRWEREMLLGHRFVDVQSAWMAAQVRAINPGAQLHDADCALRPDFESASPWQWSGAPVVFTTSAYPAPFKGLHLAVRAAALLQRRWPDLRLRIAGPHQRPGIRLDGYVRWVNSLVRAAGMTQQVDWLGTIGAADLVRELQSASAALIPSYVESYGVAMAEAMRVGTPVVSTFTGGTGHLGRDGETCVFFPTGDAASCAFHLDRVIGDRELALGLSRRARAVAAARHDRADLVRRQVETYRHVVASAAPAGGGVR